LPGILPGDPFAICSCAASLSPGPPDFLASACVRAGTAPRGAFASTGAETLSGKDGTARVLSGGHVVCTCSELSFQLPVLLMIEGSSLHKNLGATNSRYFNSILLHQSRINICQSEKELLLK
jgi:hypothetical protein